MTKRCVVAPHCLYRPLTCFKDSRACVCVLPTAAAALFTCYLAASYACVWTLSALRLAFSVVANVCLSAECAHHHKRVVYGSVSSVFLYWISNRLGAQFCWISFRVMSWQHNVLMVCVAMFARLTCCRVYFDALRYPLTFFYFCVVKQTMGRVCIWCVAVVSSRVYARVAGVNDILLV